jgi:lysophospholipase L1-like esterase
LTRQEGIDGRLSARVLAALFGLLAGLDVLAALVLEVRAAAAVGTASHSFETAARQAVASRDLLIVAGCLLVTAAIVSRLDLGERATNLVLASGIAAWLGLSALCVLPLAVVPAGRTLDRRETEAPIAVADPRLGHRLVVGRAGPYRTNADGFRGPALPPRRSAAELRVVALGDSITFGWQQLDDEATYPLALEREFRKRQPERTIHVLNAGVPSYSSLQAARLVEDRLASWRPDLLIVCIGWNDLSYGYEPRWTPLISIDPTVEQVRPLLRWRRPGAEPSPSLAPGAPAELRRNLAALVAAAKRQSVDVLLLNLPTVLSRAHTAGERQLAGRFADVDLRAFQSQIEATCRTGVKCFLNAFPVEETGKERFFIDHCHLSPAGARELARRLADVLMPDGSAAPGRAR